MLNPKDYYYMLKCRNQWIKKNKNNFTKVGKNKNREILGLLKSGKIKIGKGTYGHINIDSLYAENEGLYIGAYCSISSQSTFLLSGEHNIKSISTYPFDEFLFFNSVTKKSKGPIVIEDDVWICDHSIILSGVHIGKGAVVAAGAVVTKDVPPYAVVGGNPAKVIKYRFSDKIIEGLMGIDYNFWNDEFIRENEDIFCSDFNEKKLEILRNEMKS